MSILKIPGVELYYEVSGDGPLLILIPGASGTGEIFRRMAELLAAQYKVVIYDRRGFSHSELDGSQDYERRLDTDVDDVRQLIGHLTGEPAIIFGNSSGAIVALEVLIRDPQRVRIAIAHEPPVVNLLPDATRWLALFDEVYNLYRQAGVTQAMHRFAYATLGGKDRQLMARNMKLHTNERDAANAAYWMEHELRQYPRVNLDLDILAKHAKQLVLVGGRDSQDQMTYQPNKILAQRLGLGIVDFPGGHLGFAADPVAFAKKLLNVLNDERR